MTYHWHRAAPGLYYLWDRPRNVHVASVKGSSRFGVKGAVSLAGFEWTVTGRTNPAGMIALVEAEILTKQPSAVFIRENFH